MSSWGNKDDIASPGTVSLSGLTVTGSGTFFANNYSSGDIITIADAGGAAVINVIANATSMTLVSNTELTAGTLSDKQYAVSEKCVYVIDTDTNMRGDEVFGVSVAEMAFANTTSDREKVAHGGWVRFSEKYTDANGNVRQKAETLVAMSTITGDADDDTGDVALPQ